MNLKRGDRIGALACYLDATNTVLFDITIYNSELLAEYLGGLVAAQIRSGSINQVKLYSSIINTNSITGDSYIGSVFALTHGQILIQQCYVTDMQLFAKSDNVYSLSGGIVGDLYVTQMTLCYAIVQDSTLAASGSATQVSAGGIFSWLFDKSVEITDSKVIKTNIQTFSASKQANCGGLLGFINNQPAIITNSYVKSIVLQISGVQKYAGLIQGRGLATVFTASRVYTDGTNYINGVLIINCANVINQSQNGC
ncbi:Hypothetical_protein [Hexamita inflata]|uniref:Hypothetical_protein n=1 Tax=Hexamita inflata TaxID=28002 RepID=A0AA86U0C5_9EUKA|nr:Hypothetical protein HINF_LOCUS24585 [Hexamita inflata]